MSEFETEEYQAMTEKEKRRKRFGNGLKNVGKVLVELGLPAVAGAVLGPGGASVAGRIADAIGLDPDNATDDQIEQALVESNPELLIELRQMEFELQSKQIEYLTTESQEVTKRHQADLATEHPFLWLFRPGCMIISVGLYFLFSMLSVFLLEGETLQMAQSWGDNWYGLCKTQVYFFFGSRGIEKVAKMAPSVQGYLERVVGGRIQSRVF